MIAKKAYYRYEKKGGTGDDPVEDWMAAEAEIEKHLKVFCQSEPQMQEPTPTARCVQKLEKSLKPRKKNQA